MFVTGTRREQRQQCVDICRRSAFAEHLFAQSEKRPDGLLAGARVRRRQLRRRGEDEAQPDERD
jgi:hypothetical protein